MFINVTSSMLTKKTYVIRGHSIIGKFSFTFQLHSHLTSHTHSTDHYKETFMHRSTQDHNFILINGFKTQIHQQLEGYNASFATISKSGI